MIIKENELVYFKNQIIQQTHPKNCIGGYIEMFGADYISFSLKRQNNKAKQTVKGNQVEMINTTFNKRIIIWSTKERKINQQLEVVWTFVFSN